jgi:hypothetical protein
LGNLQKLSAAPNPHAGTAEPQPWHCQRTCCWRKQRITKFPYQGNVPTARITGMDLAHTDSFRGLADITVFNLVDPVDRLSNFYGKRIWPLDNSTAPCLQPSTTIYVQSHWFSNHFVPEILPLINTTFTLVSHNGDVVLPGDNAAVRALLDDPRLIHWFAMSCASDHPKLTCLPLGPSLWKMTDNTPNFDILAQLLHSGEAGLVQGIFTSRLHPKSPAKQLLVNFNMGNSPTRAPLWQLTCNSSDSPLQSVSTCLEMSHTRDMRQFFKEVAAHRFVLAPRGAGPDTYRAWETLLLGSYPIVPDQDIAHLYASLPVLVLKDMQHKLTPQLLEQTYVQFSNRGWQYHTLFIGHWFNIVYRHRYGHNKQYRFEYKYAGD